MLESEGQLREAVGAKRSLNRQLQSKDTSHNQAEASMQAEHDAKMAALQLKVEEANANLASTTTALEQEKQQKLADLQARMQDVKCAPVLNLPSCRPECRM